jgi:type II secretory pathway pseudopilin PulG
MEVLVVAAILVILASVASVGVLRYLDDAKERAAVTGLTKLEEAVGAYKILNNGEWPLTLDQLAEVQPDGKAAYIEAKELRDPWDVPYVYEVSNRHPATGKPRIYSTGGGAKIISNW